MKGGNQDYTGVRTAAIVAELERRFPCQALPYGVVSGLATEFGVSRERVRQIANAYGFEGRLKTPVRRRACGGCGKPMTPNTTRNCDACAWVELPCTNCNAPVRRRAADLANRMKQYGAGRFTPQGKPTAYTGRVFCNHKCYGAWAGKNFGLHTEYQRARRAEQVAS